MNVLSGPAATNPAALAEGVLRHRAAVDKFYQAGECDLTEFSVDETDSVSHVEEPSLG